MFNDGNKLHSAEGVSRRNQRLGFYSKNGR